MSKISEQATYSFTVNYSEEKTFDTITIYALDYAVGCVLLPDDITFEVNGVEYKATITPKANNITTAVAELDKAVTSKAITVKVTTAAQKNYFNMFSEISAVAVNPIEPDPEPTPDPVSRGDINKDGEINSVDYLLLKRNCFGTYEFDEEQIVLGDINKDDKIDSVDYLLLKRVCFGTYVTE